MNREHAVPFLGGFLVGKIVTLVSMLPIWGFLPEDPSIPDILLEEFVYQLLCFNLYHYALAVICGLILAIWIEGRRLEGE
ncbi:MAG: hypothetical protein GTN93_01500 [Anaerolineae bacterium]|nr:hypothetical protein [Anaerolineae bacterium]